MEHQNWAPNIALFWNIAAAGSYGYIFSNNFGVPAIYGLPATDNNCIIGLHFLEWNPNQGTYFGYTQSGSTITGLSYSSNQLQSFMLIMCFVQCPTDMYTHNGTTSCLACNLTLDYCTSCQSNSTCLSC